MVQIHLRTCLNYRQIQTEDFFPWCPIIFKFGSEATQLDIKISDPITKLLNSEPKVLVLNFHRKFKVRNDCILNIKIMTRQNSLIGKAYDSYL